MIGLDTNAVLRLMLVDETAPHQMVVVRNAISKITDQVFIGHVVLAELAWVVARKLQFSRDAIAELLERLLRTPGIEVADVAVVAEAVNRFKIGGPGFVDHLIAALNGRHGCRTTLTFDKMAANSGGFTLLTEDESS